MDKQTILKEIEELILEGEAVLTSDYQGVTYKCVKAELYVKWRTKILFFLKRILESDDINIKTIEKMELNFHKHAASCMGILKDVKCYIQKDYIDFQKENNINVEGILDNVFKQFHKVARQLRNRYSDRSTIDIEDEYDVQDLLHAILHLFFEDIRSEEWTPSYAGKCARVDFLLKNEQVVIEVKKTRKGLTDKEVGDQLLVDIDRYKTHPDCKKLVCFVYDPEGRIGNPVGLINDINGRHKGFAKVVIQPNV